MTNRFIVGFVGPSESGKSEACRRLIENWGFVRVHAGMAIKDAARAGFRLSYEQVDGADINLSAPQLGGVKPRAVLEAIGKAVHEVAPLATAARLESDISLLPANAVRVVVDGIRKRSEVEAVERLAGTIIRIVRPERPGNPLLPMDVLQAEIEANGDIENDGSLDDFLMKIDRIGRSFRTTAVALAS